MAGMTHTPRQSFLVLLAVVALLAAACGDDDGSGDAADGAGDDASGGTLVVYSGRNEELIGPLLDQFEAESGISVEARYGESADLALLIDTEGDQSPADVFISQSPGALGFLDGGERLEPLPDEVVAAADPEAVSDTGTWAGLSGRVRTLVYNTETVDPADLPASVFDLTDDAYGDRVGVAPANGSFQDFVTAMRSLEGEETTATWLGSMHDNGAREYAKNSAIVEAVQRGEIDMGLVNHYYNERAKAELGDDVKTENHFFAEGDPGSLTLVTGAGVVDTTDQAGDAGAFILFMLSEEAQQFFAAETLEYPLAAGVEPTVDLPPEPPLSVDGSVLVGGLERTRELIVEAGFDG